jgi:Dolichyl-phosphate-mannose-protein mannosyltransferase
MSDGPTAGEPPADSQLHGEPPAPPPETRAARGQGRGAWRPPLSYRTLAIIGIVVLIVVGAVLRFDVIGSNNRVSSDENGNGGDANSILAHERYRTLRWPPGTPFLLALATRLDGHRQMAIVTHSHQPAQYAQLAVEIVTLGAVAAIAWLIAGPWAALIGVALLAFYQPLIFITRTYLSEPLGGLMILATFAAAAWARKRGWRALAAAGVLAGFGCLTREDLFPAVIVIAVAIACALWRSSHRRAMLSAALYLACTVLVIAPWVVYASGRDGRFVPITDGGPDAFFVGSYLPGKGQLFYVVKSFKGRVCQHSAASCRRYSVEGSAAMFRYVASQHPGLSPSAAVTKADIENVKKYALGEPLAFVGMLANKLWKMWSFPWSGGNGSKPPDTSRTEHLIFVGLAWIGLLGGALLTRRWSLVTVTAGLVVTTALNILVNAQGRDNMRFVPLLFAFGAAGLVLMLQRAYAIRQGRARAPAAPAPRTTLEQSSPA